VPQPPDPDTLLGQAVIVYWSAEYKRDIVYATAYGKSEVQRQVLFCVERHGRSANVRSLPAAEWARTSGGGRA
jgi:hypothetical protein